MKRYLMYLRKSRMDTDYDQISIKETLNRHRNILEAFCNEKRLNVVETLEEVVSGESLYSRPKMQRLLELVNTGMYAGIVCIDIERLSRGSSLESGYIMQILQTNNCKIITPYKTYDLQNESDEQFTDMKFMFSRYELKTITKRLVRGRKQSASEGKFLGSMAPYGYRTYKLPGTKGNSLCIDENEAEIVRMIFDMYGNQGIGYNTIAYHLNKLQIPSRNGTWGQTSVVNILNNEVYLGMIRWGHQPSKRIVRDGILTKKRILNKDYELYEGLHEPIITQEQWDAVRTNQRERKNVSVSIHKQLANPFASILFCAKCGAPIKRNVPSKSQKTLPWYRCPTRGCDCRSIKCNLVEQSVLDTMKNWLSNYTIQSQTDGLANNNNIDCALSAIQHRLNQLSIQQDNICRYLEQGVYSIDMFTKRNDTIIKEVNKLKVSEANLLNQKTSDQNISKNQYIPITEKILDSYSELSVTEKNSLWKNVMEKITMYRTPDGEFNLHIYPKLPMVKSL